MDKFRDFARPPQVENLINAEAGLLTCSVRAAFPPLLAVTIMIARTYKNLQQRGLSGIFTRFPFHRNPKIRLFRTFANANVDIFFDILIHSTLFFISLYY